jgi:hypothetical protein
VRFNDSVADSQSHVGAVSFGGKKGIEDVVRLLQAQPHTRISIKSQRANYAPAMVSVAEG